MLHVTFIPRISLNPMRRVEYQLLGNILICFRTYILWNFIYWIVDYRRSLLWLTSPFENLLSRPGETNNCWDPAANDSVCMNYTYVQYIYAIAIDYKIIPDTDTMDHTLIFERS